MLYLRIIVTGLNAHLSVAFLQEYLADPAYWLLYLLGMLASVFHFCNGITTFCMTWGIAKGPRCQRIISYGFMLLCTVLRLISVWFMAFYLT